jgi:C-terminal processing protease CtpA/Prc
MRSMTRLALALLAALGLAGLPATVARAQSERDDPFAIGLALRWHEGCPLVVGSVSPKSPASVAGIQSGDHLLKIGGVDARLLDGIKAAGLLRSDRADPVTLTLSRGGKPYSVVVKRERLSSLLARQGKKIVAGSIVPLDTTEAEIARNAAFNGSRIVARVFPLHYPLDLDLYYGGFEVFVLRDPDEVTVGGLEEGPASRAGAHWGDRILAVNGVDPRGKPELALEQLFSSERPETMRLKIARPASTRTLEFPLARTADLLEANGLRLANGQLAPIGMSEEDVRCLTQQK